MCLNEKAKGRPKEGQRKAKGRPKEGHLKEKGGPLFVLRQLGTAVGNGSGSGNSGI